MLCECKDKNYFACLQITGKKAPSLHPSLTPSREQTAGSL